MNTINSFFPIEHEPLEKSLAQRLDTKAGEWRENLRYAVKEDNSTVGDEGTECNYSRTYRLDKLTCVIILLR